MTADIFDSHKEPDELFLPLSHKRYCQFYALETSDFSADVAFYLERITASGSILELGCGYGRLCRQLAATGAAVTGIDLSLSMLQLARLHDRTNISYMCMDMTALALARKFDTIIIAYHSLNLLVSESRIKECLRQLKTVIKANGNLLLQLFIPDHKILTLGSKKLFQFQIFNEQTGGKVIKEIRRGYKDEKLLLEERYRVRPRAPEAVNEDLSHTLELAAFSADKWQALLHDCGFNIRQQFGGYDRAPFLAGRDSCLLIEANPA